MLKLTRVQTKQLMYAASHIAKTLEYSPFACLWQFRWLGWVCNETRLPSQLFIIIRLSKNINGHTQHGGELHEQDMPMVSHDVMWSIQNMYPWLFHGTSINTSVWTTTHLPSDNYCIHSCLYMYLECWPYLSTPSMYMHNVEEAHCYVCCSI